MNVDFGGNRDVCIRLRLVLGNSSSYYRKSSVGTVDADASGVTHVIVLVVSTWAIGFRILI